MTGILESTENKRMEIFELMAEAGHEQVAFWSDPELGYRGIIAIHDTSMGPRRNAGTTNPTVTRSSTPCASRVE